MTSVWGFSSERGSLSFKGLQKIKHTPGQSDCWSSFQLTKTLPNHNWGFFLRKYFSIHPEESSRTYNKMCDYTENNDF